MTQERAFIASPLSVAGGRAIASPLQFFTTGEDNLRIISVNTLAGVRLKLQGRRLTDAGKLEPFAYDHTPNSDRTVATDDYPLGIGAVMNLSCFATGGTPKIGQTFVIVQIIRGLGAAAIVLGTLLQGYVTSTQGLGWPGSPIQTSTEGPGYTRIITGTDPAAGANVSETVPTGARWQLLALEVEFDTDATVIDRTVFLDFVFGGGILFRAAPPLTIPASMGAQCSWGAGVAAVGQAAYATFQGSTPAPLILPAGTIIRTGVGNGQAGDNFRAPTYTVQEWLEVL